MARHPCGRCRWPIVLAASCARPAPVGSAQPGAGTAFALLRAPGGSPFCPQTRTGTKFRGCPSLPGGAQHLPVAAETVRRETIFFFFFNVLSMFSSRLCRVLWSIFTLLTWLSTLWLSCNCGKAFFYLIMGNCWTLSPEQSTLPRSRAWAVSEPAFIQILWFLWLNKQCLFDRL